MRTKQERYSLIGNLNGHTERLATSLNGALVATVNIVALQAKWGADLIAVVNLGIGAWITFGYEVLRTRLSMLIKANRVEQTPVEVRVPIQVTDVKVEPKETPK